MATITHSPRAVAVQASKVMGRPVTDKQVRGLARDTIARFDKVKHPAYQSHEYSAAEVRSLMAVFGARAGRGRAVTRKSSKAATVTRKAARTVKATTNTPEVSE